MLVDILWLLVGLGLLVAGGNAVTDGSVAIARRFNMPGLMVGVLIVAFSSSVPDLAVGVISTIGHKSELAVGDVVGSAIFDFLLVVGLMAVCKPFKVSRDVMRTDLPIAVVCCCILFFLADDRFIDGAPVNVIDRSDGLVLLTGIMLFMAYTVSTAKQQIAMAPSATTSAPPARKPLMKLWVAAIYIVVGLGALVLGAQWFVDGASGVARRMGMSVGLVGLTVVAIGGSLPDLATSLIAALKNQPGIALGNILGGTIYNVLLVLGTSSVIHPLKCASIKPFDFVWMLGAAAVVWLLAALSKKGMREFGRVKGVFLILCYVVYMTLLVLRN